MRTNPRLLGYVAPKTATSSPEPRRRHTRRQTIHKIRNEPVRARYERQRCLCGACATCMENARWERIFLEKFADPSYYAESPGRSRSPLHM